MLPDLHKILFFVFALVAGGFGLWGFYRLFLRVRRGAAATEARFDQPLSRILSAVQVSLTQERTFRRRTAISVLHSFIFYGFVYYLLVNVVDGLEGYLPFHLYSKDSPLLAGYNLLADVLSFLVLVGVLSLLVRRLFLPSKRDFRFTEKTLLHPLLRANYILRDSLIVSSFITFHVGCRILGNAAKMVEESRKLGTYDAFQPISSALGSAMFSGLSDSALLNIRIFGYWGALGSVLAFLAYFPFTKHIHIFMAPLNYALKRPVGSGVLPPMKGLEAAMEAEEPKLGVEKLEDLEWPRLLDAYACIQCNRCQDVCPANATGKALSPAALEINKRMELNVIGSHPSPFSLRPAAFESGASTAHPLLEFAINEESVWACTTCGACMQVCPVQDEQMLDIIDIRRHQVMVAGEFPPQLQTAFRGMERASNPWGISRDKRMEWAEGLKVPTIDENPTPDVIYWVGCAASYDPGAQKVARSFVQLLDKAGVNYAVLGKKEACTGDSARRAGNEFLYQTLAQENVETLNTVNPKLIVATCPHCMNAIGHEYKQLGGDYRTVHHTEYLETLVAAGKLPMAELGDHVAFHDPCYLGRHNGVYDAPRTLISRMAGEVLELERQRENSFCCGAGGAQFWKEEEEGRERVSDNRFREIQARLDAAAEAEQAYKEGRAPGSSAPGQRAPEKVVAVGCPFCKSMMNSTPEKQKRDDIVVKDVAELMLESVNLAGVQRATGEWNTTPVAAPKDDVAQTPAASAAAHAPVPNAESPMERTGQTPGAGAPASVVGETAADVINAQPGSPVANADTQPEPQAAHPEAQPAPARKAWKPKGSGDDVNAAPVAPVTPAAPPEVATPSAPARKAWKPKGSGDDVSAAPVLPTPEAAPVSETVSETAVTPGSVDTAPADAAPARKAWKPRATQSEAAPAPQAETVAPTPTAAAAPAGPPTGAEVPAATERKKWSPKGATPAATPPAPAAEASTPASNVPVGAAPAAPAPSASTTAPEAGPTGERKKWAPKAKAAEAAPGAGVVTPTPDLTPITEHLSLAQVDEHGLERVGPHRDTALAEDAMSTPAAEDTPQRKKWVPKKKD